MSAKVILTLMEWLLCRGVRWFREQHTLTFHIRNSLEFAVRLTDEMVKPKSMGQIYFRHLAPTQIIPTIWARKSVVS